MRSSPGKACSFPSSQPGTRLSKTGRLPEGREALRVYESLREQGRRPSIGLIAAALKTCGRLKLLGTGKRIHGHVVESGDVGKLVVANTLVDMYAKCGSIAAARRAFDAMVERDVVSWNCIIGGYAQYGQGQALELYDRMRDEGFVPDAVTFVAALRACAGIAAAERDDSLEREVSKCVLQKGRDIHSLAVGNGHEGNMYVASVSVDMYAKCGSMSEASQVFEKMTHRDVVSWTAMIMGYAQCGEGGRAVELYERMLVERVTPNAVTYVAVLKACACLAEAEAGELVGDKLVKTQSLEKGRCVHSRAYSAGYEHDLFVASTLVDMYSKCRSMGEASKVFSCMERRDVVSWTAIIMGYAQDGEGQTALDLYACMQEEGTAPNAATFVALVKACGSLGDLAAGRQIHRQVYNAGLESDGTLLCALVDFYGKCGSMQDAEAAFGSLVNRRNLTAWSALVAGYARQGDTRRSFGAFEDMQKVARLKPDSIVFLSVLNACNHAGLVDQGMEYFQAMVNDCGISPGLEHYTCLIDLLGRSNQLDEAVAMVERMPFVPDKVIWTAVLNAACKWNDLRVGKLAFDELRKLGAQAGAGYVLMFNAYAGAGILESCT